MTEARISAARPTTRSKDHAFVNEIYKQANASVEDRVSDLLGRMTLEEKVAQLSAKTTLYPMLTKDASPAFGVVDKDGAIDEAIARSALRDGIGSFFVLSMMPAREYALTVEAIQTWLVNNTRLGIPALFHCEGLHGASLVGATTFPQSIGLGSSWNRDLVKEVFEVTATELRSAGVASALAPVFDLARDPRYGRVEEMYSEDPYLVGELGVAAVRGLQGDGEVVGRDHVVATAKHYVHGVPENGTNNGPSDVTERTMRSTYLAPFEKAVKVARIGSIMASYNENEGGIPTHASSWLLSEVLRDEWGFEGLVVSDFGGVGRLADQQHVVGSHDDAGELAFRSGLDVELPATEGFTNLAAAVRAGRIDESAINAAVSRVLTTKFAAGLFEDPLPRVDRVDSVVGSPEHAVVARRAADQSAILLKNDGGLLPLDETKIKKIAVIGPNADKVRFGTYAGTPPYFVTILDGIRKRVGSATEVTFAQGVRIGATDTDPSANKISRWEAPSFEEDSELIREAVDAARDADVVVLALGGNEQISNEAFEGMLGLPPVHGDSDELELPGRQNELVREIAALSKQVVAVLLNGRPHSIVELASSVPAIIEGWYSGQETGNAIAGIIFGDVNPSGRLPVTIARSVGQLPVYYSHTPAARLGYVFHDNTPLYPFGYGLSYTEFEYGEPRLDHASIFRDGSTVVSVDVTNIGSRRGTEVAQMYVHPKISSVVQPVLRLAGFERVDLEPGQTRTVSFEIGTEELAILDRAFKRTVEVGVVEILVGRNAADTRAVDLEILP